MARVASQRFVFTKNYIVVFLFDHIIISPHFSKQTKRALKFCEDLSKFQPVNSDLRPFRAFWMMSVPIQPTLKLKSGIHVYFAYKKPLNIMSSDCTGYSLMNSIQCNPFYLIGFDMI